MNFFLGFISGVALFLVIQAMGEGNRKRRFRKWQREEEQERSLTEFMEKIKKGERL
jgi:hypothetical protein